MSSEEEADQRFREMRRTTPEWWRDVYIDEYIGDDEPERTEAREDFDAMIEQIERRVLAQQPCYYRWTVRISNPDMEDCHAAQRSPFCPSCAAKYPCTARAAQTQETSG